MKYWNPETKQLQDSPYVKVNVEQKVEVEPKVEKKRTRKKEV